MLPKFVKFIVVYLILLTWLFNFDLSESLRLCNKNDKPPKLPKAKPSDYRGHINIRCHNPHVFVHSKRTYTFKYNKNGNLDVSKLKDVIKEENFGIYIVGFGDLEVFRDMGFVDMFLDWADAKKSSVCAVQHSEPNHTYPDSVKYRLPHVGEVVGEFLVFLQNQGLISIEKTTAAGFSLGAHMIGEGLKYVHEKTNEKPPLLIALDPSRRVPDALRVTKLVAKHVQGVYSSIISNGKKVGHANFKLNGSRIQPGCGVFDIQCSHVYPIELFRDTVSGEKKFYGTNKKDKNKTCLFGIHNVEPVSGDFDLIYENKRVESIQILPYFWNTMRIVISSLIDKNEDDD